MRTEPQKLNRPGGAETVGPRPASAQAGPGSAWGSAAAGPSATPVELSVWPQVSAAQMSPSLSLSLPADTPLLDLWPR